MTIKAGLAIHCHHDILIEWCYDYAGRVSAIRNKPRKEVETRLHLFRLLSDEAIADLPGAITEANKARHAAGMAWDPGASADWHQKWCGCTEWNGKEIIFGGDNP